MVEIKLDDYNTSKTYQDYHFPFDFVVVGGGGVFFPLLFMAELV